jgi:hypothetical protein
MRVSTVALAIAAMMNSPCQMDRDKRGTIQPGFRAIIGKTEGAGKAYSFDLSNSELLVAICNLICNSLWGLSSVGRAPQWH